MQADHGGTELKPPLAFICQSEGLAWSPSTSDGTQLAAVCEQHTGLHQPCEESNYSS